MATLAYNQCINGRKTLALAKVFYYSSVNTGKPTVLMLPKRIFAVWQFQRS